MEQVLLIGGDDSGMPFRRLAYGGYPLISCNPDRLPQNLHELAKICDVVVVCADQIMGRVIADEIWHLLRRKIVISTTPGFDLSMLRDLYPLSKVCRCDLVLDGDVDRCLAVVSFGDSFSELDMASMKRIFSSIGEMLVINEPLFQEVRATISEGFSSLSELLRRLGPDDFQEYLLGWVMYCLGQMILKGNPIEGCRNPQGKVGGIGDQAPPSAGSKTSG
ncbi:MAG: hypothetical protein ABC585_01935 [Candidatus Methanosuratincola petrocarbonis]|nr:hypothetical protein [Candidatus Methanosuratincola sp.]